MKFRYALCLILLAGLPACVVQLLYPAMASGDTGRSKAKNAPAVMLAVTNTNDSGPGSLRQAIIDANANINADTITFSIGTGA